MIDVASYAWEFREAILQGSSSERMCVAVSAPLHAALRMLDVRSELVRADLEQGEHVFLQLPGGQVLDATADQFNAHSRQPLPGVYLGAPMTPHHGARPWSGGQEWHALMAELRRLYPAFAAPEVGRTVALQAEIVNLQVFVSFQGAGKVIFDMAKVLTQTLAHTDAHDIPCGELVFPAQSFYLHFGAASGLVDEGLAVEGAFVTHYGERMAVDLVTQGFGQPHFLALPLGERVTGVSVLLTDPDMPLAQALETSVEQAVERAMAAREHASEMERQLEQQYGQVVKVPVPIESLAEKVPLLQQALSLIVNSMFYLAAEPDDVQEDWESATPTEALHALRAATKPSAIKNLVSNLRNARYSKVRFVGRQFAQSLAGQEIQSAQDSGRRLATHFRRGHFRRQRYGPDGAFTKRIFVAPVVVNAGAGGNPLGRVYDVQ